MEKIGKTEKKKGGKGRKKRTKKRKITKKEKWTKKNMETLRIFILGIDIDIDL